MGLDKVLLVTGRAFISAGILVFLFVGYQLWGTNISEARSQKALASQVEGFPTTVPRAAGATTTVAPTPNTTPAPPPAPLGDAVAVIQIPKIGLEKTVVEGTGVPDLKKGPGHYLGTPLPGQPGNAAIAGHRTTYGAPFTNLDQLDRGDEIFITTKQGSFVYKVTDSTVVLPSEVSVLAPTTDNRLTLTTCHPKYSAAKRLIITAALQEGTVAPGPTSTTPTTPATIPGDESGATEHDLSLSGQSADKTPVLIWGAIAAFVAAFAYIAARTWTRWLYLLGGPVFLVVLFVFFENFSRLLPANA